MSDNDYLWDGSGTPDPDVERLEEVLRPLRHTGSPPALPARQAPRRPMRMQLAAAAAVAAIMGTAWFASRIEVPGAWTVTTTTSAGSIESRLRPGGWVITDDSTRARIEVADIGTVDVEPGSRVRMVSTDLREHRLSLENGGIFAVVDAPPRLFVVDTPAATAVDLGCVYSLRVADDGSSVLSVSSGWVELEGAGRKTFVAAGTTARTTPEAGPGLPVRLDASGFFKLLVEGFDREPSRAVIENILRSATDADAVTVWHMMERVAPELRDGVRARLTALHPQRPRTDDMEWLEDILLERWDSVPLKRKM